MRWEAILLIVMAVVGVAVMALGAWCQAQVMIGLARGNTRTTVDRP